MTQSDKHLYEAGWDPDRENLKDFQAKRDIDLQRAEEKELGNALRITGYHKRGQRDQIMQSAVDPSFKTAEGQSNWQVEKVKAGTKFYSLTTVTDNQHGWKSAGSAYWLDEEEVKKLEQEKLIDVENKKIEAAILKDRYAIPCSNKVNGLVEAKVVQDHDAVRTTVGPGKDIYTVDNEERSRRMNGGGRQWHPKLDSLELDRMRGQQKLAERDGHVANYRNYEIRYSRADLQSPAARQKDREFGAKVEACHKALGESRQAQDYDPAARAEYAKRKTEMDGYAAAIAKDPTLMDEIRDEKLRKSLQERASQGQRQNTPSLHG